MNNEEDQLKKIIVTGATSMLGTALIDVAVSKGTEVYAIVRPDTNRMDRLNGSDLVHVVSCALEDLDKLCGIPSDCDALFHFAWEGAKKEEREDPMTHARNIKYTLDAVEVAKRFGCKKFIGVGSQAEYGPVGGVILEDTPCAPKTPYGIGKLAAGLLSRKLCEKNGIIHIWGRVFSVYGPHDNKGTMIDYAIERFSNRERAQFSSGEQAWNYLYESDCGMIFFLLGEKIESDSIYRIAHPESRALRDYISEMADIMDAKDLCSFAEKTGDGSVYGIETKDEKLFSDIGFVPEVSFAEGIRRILNTRGL